MNELRTLTRFLQLQCSHFQVGVSDNLCTGTPVTIVINVAFSYSNRHLPCPPCPSFSWYSHTHPTVAFHGQAFDLTCWFNFSALLIENEREKMQRK